MSNRENFNKAVGWLIGEWLEEEGVEYTEQLFKAATDRVDHITGYIGKKHTGDFSMIPWYELDKINEIYFGDGDLL